MASPRVLKVQITDITCGENVTIIEPSNVYGCELKDDVFVGPFVEIQRTRLSVTEVRFSLIPLFVSM